MGARLFFLNPEIIGINFDSQTISHLFQIKDTTLYLSIEKRKGLKEEQSVLLILQSDCLNLRKKLCLTFVGHVFVYVHFKRDVLLNPLFGNGDIIDITKENIK